MKKLLLILLLIANTINSQNTYDLSKVKTGSGLAELYMKIMDEHKELYETLLIEFLESSKVVDKMIVPERKGRDYRSEVDAIKIGLHYDGIPLETVFFSNNSMRIITASKEYSAKKILDKIENENGLTINYTNKKEYEWDTETKDIDLKVKLVNGENLAKLGDKDFAEVRFKFKPFYKMPVANIHKEIKTFKEQPDYVFADYSENCIYDIFINNVKVQYPNKINRLHINKFITNKVTSVKIIVKPDPNISTDKRVYFSATILDQVTNTIIKDIGEVFLEDNLVVFEAEFNSKLPYYPEAWTNGVNLRKDKKLKEKIIALYDKLGKAILSNDEQVLNDMFYQKQYEVQQMNFDKNFVTARSKWWMLLNLQEQLKYTISKDFDIIFSADDKLIYAKPKDKEMMLSFEDTTYGDGFSFYLYQPKKNKELKIIR